MKFNAILILGALIGFFIMIQAIPIEDVNVKGIENSNGLKARDTAEHETELEKRQRTSNSGYSWYRDGNSTGNLRTGLGAVKLSPEVKKVSLTFTRKQDNAGARYFLRENLPRIAYHNPNVPIEVNISKEYGVKPILKIEFDPIPYYSPYYSPPLSPYSQSSSYRNRLIPSEPESIRYNERRMNSRYEKYEIK
ncbi:2650_t:CDS:2 [Diversispora eburnea]|uniref:2650_t:CDS:1 n=1 Tax=Diversispora eburnea TaxID=1213867 RepID=A0A9N8ZLB4_9GLOM|nr:2650_t:CDS:2 [Diversispora eburnea]